MTTGQRKVAFGVIGIGLLVLVVASWMNPDVQSTPPTPSPTQLESHGLTSAHREMIAAALHEALLPEPQSLEVNESGYLVATFEGPQPSAAAAQNFASRALMSIRNAMFNRHVISDYRVTLNAPSSGPDLTLRYGSAQFSEGGAIEWLQQK